ncbi:helix-turn-helix domain-containing protein [Empedobacter falsenii]|uniref:helix-turn-helix domain-containing protein n=1 Tax=Empedobacter falsenii TaxID=343874 RepID=UPI002577E0B5|nr:helix-turn-helix domain-containing protein [Empedobacter falsenii]MDM1298196.1 helix-turn-helix domain-containing protein [Empedobacter falsenii]MDM1318247.1 helix-turn-helix domain-containing protein [Empedobacter falsenii]
MKQIENSNEDILALLEAVVCIKKELLYIKEYFQPLLRGEIYLNGKQVCDILHISKRTLQQYRVDGLIPFIKLEQKILFRESDITKVLEDNYQRQLNKKEIT